MALRLTVVPSSMSRGYHKVHTSETFSKILLAILQGQTELMAIVLLYLIMSYFATVWIKPCSRLLSVFLFHYLLCKTTKYLILINDTASIPPLHTIPGTKRTTLPPKILLVGYCSSHFDCWMYCLRKQYCLQVTTPTDQQHSTFYRSNQKRQRAFVVAISITTLLPIKSKLTWHFFSIII